MTDGLFEGVPYYQPVDQGEIRYSVDKLIIKAELSEEYANSLLENPYLLQNTANLLRYKEKHNFDNTIKITYLGKHISPKGVEGTIQVTFCIRGASRKNTCEIECNPNKCFWSDDCLADICMLLQNCMEYYVYCMDIAMDIPVKTKDVRVEKDHRSMTRYCRSIGNETIYLGKRGEPKNVRVYDKQVESKLTHELTRVEITIGNPLSENDLEEISGMLPTVYIPEIQQDADASVPSTFSSTDRVLISSLRKSDDRCNLLKMLEPKKTKKLRPYVLAQDKKVEFDVDTIKTVALNVLHRIECGCNIRKKINYLVLGLPV